MDWVQIGKDFASDFIVLLLQAIVPLIVTAIVGALALMWQKLKAEKPDVAYRLALVMGMFIEAAEQSKVTGFVENKLDYVTDLANTWLKNNGFKLDAMTVRAIIESAVHEADFPHVNDQAGTA